VINERPIIEPCDGLAKILSNSAVMFVRTGVEVGVNFLLSVILVRELGQTALGTYIYASSLSALIYSILGFGINAIIIREVAKAPTRIRKLVSNAIAIRVCLTLPAGFIIAYALSLILRLEGDTRRVVWLVALLVGLGFVNDLIFGVFQAVGKFRYHLMLSIFYKICTLLLAWGGIRLGYDLFSIILLFLGMQIITLIFSLTILAKRVTALSLRIDLSLWRSLILQSFPLALSGFSETVNNRSDSVMLGSMKTVSDVGIYGAAYNIYLGVGLLFHSLVVGGFPALSRLSGLSKRALADVFFRLSRLMLFSTAIAGISCFVLSSQIISLVYGTKLLAASKPLSILSLALVFFGLERLCMAALTSMGLQRLVFWSTFIGAIVNVSINIVVIPRYGYIGASYSTLATEIVMFAVGMSFFMRKYRDEQSAGRG